MTVVIDASAVVEGLIDAGKNKGWAEAALADPNLFAPELMLVETANLLRRAEIRGRVSRAEATMAFHDLLLLPFELYPFAPFADRIWELRHNVTGYDAWYVAIAEQLGCPLVTLDVNLYRASGPACEIIVPPWVKPLQ